MCQQHKRDHFHAGGDAFRDTPCSVTSYATHTHTPRNPERKRKQLQPRPATGGTYVCDVRRWLR